MRLITCITTLTVPIFLTACTASRPEPGTLLKTWSESVANLGIRPVYPLQENLYPGNLLLVPTYPGKSRSDIKPSEFYNYYPIPVGSLDLCALYLPIKNAPEMPLVENYVAPGASKDKVLTPWAPTAINYSNLNCHAYNGTDFRLNRTVAFPAFQFGALVEAGGGANLMAGTVGAKGSAAGKDDYLMTISVPSATVIRVDIADLLTARFLDRVYPRGGAEKLNSDIGAVMSAAVFIDKEGTLSMPELLLVSEVYYANAIDVSVTASAARSAQLAASTQALVERFEKLDALQRKMDALSGTSHDSGTTGQAQTTPSQNKTQTVAATETQQSIKNELVQQMSQTQSEINALSNTILPNAPGVTGAVKSVTRSGVTLTQVFPRPLAIGYRALAYDPVFFMQRLANKPGKKTP
jgi:hypothetical protein